MTTFIDGFLAQKKAIEEQTGRPVRLMRPTVQLHPLQVQRSFAVDLVKIVDALNADITELLIPELERLSRGSQLRGDDARIDVEDISAIIKTIVGDIGVRLDNKHLRGLEALVSSYFNDTAKFSRRQTFRQIRRMLGVDAFPREAQLVNMLNSFREENVALIKSMAKGHLTEVGNIVQRNLRAGTRPAFIAELLRKRFGVTRNKAKLIARDQVNKLNGSLTRMRQTGLGIEEYIWRTSRDERVRSSHLELEGRKFRWDDPPSEGHPGQAIQCRCSAEPVIEGVPKRRENRRQVIRDVLQKRKDLKAKFRETPGKASRLIATGRPRGF